MVLFLITLRTSSTWTLYPTVKAYDGSSSNYKLKSITLNSLLDWFSWTLENPLEALLVNNGLVKGRTLRQLRCKIVKLLYSREELWYWVIQLISWRPDLNYLLLDLFRDWSVLKILPCIFPYLHFLFISLICMWTYLVQFQCIFWIFLKRITQSLYNVHRSVAFLFFFIQCSIFRKHYFPSHCN